MKENKFEVCDIVETQEGNFGVVLSNKLNKRGKVIFGILWGDFDPDKLYCRTATVKQLSELNPLKKDGALLVSRIGHGACNVWARIIRNQGFPRTLKKVKNANKNLRLWAAAVMLHCPSAMAQLED